MYRAVAWKALREGLDLGDGDAVAACAARVAFTPAIDEAAAIVARHEAVRAVLVERQRRYGPGIVMEGRDIGSVVFPDADVKIYLDAAPDERARRRAGDAAHAAGRAAPGVGGVAQALEARDRSDTTRTVSPLRLAAGAVYIDTTTLAIDEVVARVMALVDAALTRSAR
jgi:cytidylate kinase